MDLSRKLRNSINKFLGGELRQSLGFVDNRRSSDISFNPEQQLTGITYKAIDKVGQTLSVYEPIFIRPNGEPYTNHPYMPVIKQPNPRYELGDFVWLYGMLMEIYGETFWYLARGENTKRIKELYLLDPSRVELKINNGEVVGYVLHKGAEQVPLELEEIYHDARPNPFNEYRGMSVLEKAAAYVNTEISTTNFTLNYINNNASPSGIVSTPDMSTEAFKMFTRQWREQYEGTKNAGKTAFIRGGEAKFNAIGATLKDIELEKVRNMTKDDVLMMIDMPKAMLGMTDESGFNRASVETLKLIYAENKLEPLMKRLDQILERIFNMSPVGGEIKINHTSPIPQDREFQHTLHKDLVNVALTVNEVRAELDLEPIEGGDVLKEPAQPQQAQMQRSKKKVKIVKKEKPTKFQLRKQRADEIEEFRKQLEENVDLYTIEVKREMTKFASKQEKEVIARINATDKAFDDWLYEIEKESEELAALVVPVLLELMEEEASNAVNFITGELVPITQQLRDEVTQDFRAIASKYHQDNRKLLEKSLAEGQQQGESLAKLKKRVEAEYKDIKGYRAERVARTETSRAGNRAAGHTFKQNGYTKEEWVINPGACEFCVRLAGEQTSIDSPFRRIGDVVPGDENAQLSISYRDVIAPPLHPNCTCRTIPVE